MRPVGAVQLGGSTRVACVAARVSPWTLRARAATRRYRHQECAATTQLLTHVASVSHSLALELDHRVCILPQMHGASRSAASLCRLLLPVSTLCDVRRHGDAGVCAGGGTNSCPARIRLTLAAAPHNISTQLDIPVSQVVLAHPHHWHPQRLCDAAGYTLADTAVTGMPQAVPMIPQLSVRVS